MIRPTDLPELRDELTRSAREGWLKNMAEQGGFQTTLKAARVAGSAELFFIDEPMVELALAAKDSLPDFRVDEEDLPSEVGLCYFARPMCTYEFNGHPSIVVGSVWEHGGHAMHVAWLIDRDFYGEHGGFPGGKLDWRNALPRLWPIEAHDWMWDRDEGAVVPAWGRLFMKAAWLLMQQTLATVSDATYDRSTRRRLERKQIEPKPIRVVSLRRPSSASTGESDREYRRRWIVRGHWRQQWYSSREVHRPVWIAPHVKGPEGAPLIGGEKVYHWRR